MLAFNLAKKLRPKSVSVFSNSWY